MRAYTQSQTIVHDRDRVRAVIEVAASRFQGVCLHFYFFFISPNIYGKEDNMYTITPHNHPHKTA